MGIEARQYPRKRVHLRVGYHRALDFVEQYAENLSAGGMFIRDATGLALRDEVALELDLPGHGTFSVVAEVAHVGPPDPTTGTRGVGLQLRKGGPGFADALNEYLMRLGRRTEATVFVDIEPWRQLIVDAGYRVEPLPPPHALVGLIGDHTAVGILAPDDVAQRYRSALAFLGEDGSLVIPVHAKLPVSPILAWLDDKLLKR
ncbi:MAG: hypothetical protein H6Q90_9 [Deltaproteobacteria bacterium]|nr:hypothetical protein [Deltaproteobacteria bacterium]